MRVYERRQSEPKNRYLSTDIQVPGALPDGVHAAEKPTAATCGGGRPEGGPPWHQRVTTARRVIVVADENHPGESGGLRPKARSTALGTHPAICSLHRDARASIQERGQN